MSRNDLDYYRNRAAVERDMAQNSADPKIAAIHEELAREYDALTQPKMLRAVG